MSEFSEHCDPVDTLDFRPGESRPIGYLLDLAVSGTTLPAGLKVAVPTDVTGPPARTAGVRLTPAVALLGSVYWSTRPSDPIRVFGYAGAEVARTLAALDTAEGSDRTVRVALVVYDYDHQHDTYFPAFRTHGGVPPAGTPHHPADPAAPAMPVYGRLGRDGLLVAQDPEDLTSDVRVHAIQFELTPVPAAQPQRIQLRSAPSATVVRNFGLPPA